eukprot:4029328-Prymnesium_polylepis.1
MFRVVLPLGGVWHAAGLLADAVLPKQEASAFARVYAPKAGGAWSMHTMASGVSHFVLFSSVVAMMGLAGQANYTASNSCLDTLATCRRAQASAGVSVQWGAWGEVGMASRGAANERMEAMEKSTGFGRIKLAQGLAALYSASQHVAPSVMGLVPIKW